MALRVICELADVSATYLTGLMVTGRTVDEATGDLRVLSRTKKVLDCCCTKGVENGLRT